MPTNPNMVAIQTVTVGAGGAASIDFQNIPNSYTDLCILSSLRTIHTDIVDDLYLRFNNNSGTNYSFRTLTGTGSSAISQNGSGATLQYIGVINGGTSTSNTFGSHQIYIPNYTSGNNKSSTSEAVQETNASTAYMNMVANLWSQTAAITRITLIPGYNNFAQYSTATLYGVTSAGTAAKATGGIITMDDNYFYHTFLSSGTFTPTSNITADYLVVAGGGGGGLNYGGGGGGGGLRSTVTATGGGGSLESALSLTAQAYTVTVGAGGAGSTSSSANGANGSNSVFSTITSTGGGGGASSNVSGRAGSSGGSGGGGSAENANTTNGPGGSASPSGQGFAGGSGLATSAGGAAGGGGGASAVGANGATAVGGNGGAGVTTSISGSSVTYAGGGGGNANGTNGAGGNGGGGAAGNPATSGTANTGGGGGGSGSTSGAGGSGIVIIRYAR